MLDVRACTGTIFCVYCESFANKMGNKLVTRLQRVFNAENFQNIFQTNSTNSTTKNTTKKLEHNENNDEQGSSTINEEATTKTRTQLNSLGNFVVDEEDVLRQKADDEAKLKVILIYVSNQH